MSLIILNRLLQSFLLRNDGHFMKEMVMFFAAKPQKT